MYRCSLHEHVASASVVSTRQMLRVKDCVGIGDVVLTQQNNDKRAA